MEDNVQVLLYGLGVTGQSAIDVLAPRGYHLDLFLDKEPQSLPDEIDHLFTKAEEPVVQTYDFLLRSSGIPLDRPLLERARKEDLEILSDIELAYRLYGGDHMVAITGSNGKTTTTTLLTHLLKEAGLSAIACGNIGNPVLSAMNRGPQGTWYILECSSFQLSTVKEFAPHLAAITNITPDHLEWHGTFEAYAACKWAIGRAQRTEDLLLLNPKDSLSCEQGEKGDWKAKIEKIDLQSDLARRLRQGENWHLFGEHNIENALFATRLAEEIFKEEGHDPATIKEELGRGLDSFQPIHDRMEKVCQVNGVDFVNDSKATNVDSTVRALESIDRPILLIAGGYDKKISFAPLVEAFRKHGKKLYLFGETKYQIQECFAKAGLADQVQVFETLSQVMKQAESDGEAGDMVLLSPASASWDMYPGYEARGDEFRELALTYEKEVKQQH